MVGKEPESASAELKGPALVQHCLQQVAEREEQQPQASCRPSSSIGRQTSSASSEQVSALQVQNQAAPHWELAKVLSLPASSDGRSSSSWSCSPRSMALGEPCPRRICTPRSQVAYHRILGTCRCLCRRPSQYLCLGPSGPCDLHPSCQQDWKRAARRTVQRPAASSILLRTSRCAEMQDRKLRPTQLN